MGQQQRASGQARAESKKKQKREREPATEGTEGTFGDRAAQGRTADDPRAQAPHDRAGMPSTGDEQL